MPEFMVQQRALLIAALIAAISVFALFTALDIGKSATHSQPVSSVSVPLGAYHARAPHVLSQLVINSSQGVVRGASSTPPAELRPVAASGFDAPVAAYRAYSVGQLRVIEGQIRRLQSALGANDRSGAQEAWRATYSRYLRLGGVYLSGEVATLNQAINGNPGGLPGGGANPKFSGLHRIEYGLWGAAEPSSLVVWAQKLEADVGKLRVALPGVSITPLEYATRAHEVLEDASRDLLSGTDVPLSGEGVLGTFSGLQATKEIIQTLRGLLGVREGVIAVVDAELAALESTFSSLAKAHGGRLPRNTELTQQESERLDGALSGALEALSQVPGTLETELAPQIPSIPKRAQRIDP
jgi:iron uptake system EfeUOB component EfeO/EfeM